MKKIENILIGLIIIFLSIHLFTLHSKLLFHLNPDKIITVLDYKFSSQLFTEDMIVSTLSAIAYSLITALILTIFVKFKNVFLMAVISFAILDGIGVFVYYNIGITKSQFILIGSIYYALYTIFIIISLGMYRNLIYNESEVNNKPIQVNKSMNELKKYPTFDEKVIHLYSLGLSQQKIARKLNTNQSKVSRTIAKNE